MADELNPTQDNLNSDEPSAGTQKTEYQKRIDSLVAQKNDALAKLANLEKAHQEREAQALQEQGKYKELYEATLKELDPLRRANEDAKRYRERLEADNQARIERIPENKRSLIPEYDDPVKLGAWLTANEAEFGAPQKPLAPNLGGGAGGANPVAAYKLSPTEEDFARMAGIPLDKYAEQKAKRGEAMELKK